MAKVEWRQDNRIAPAACAQANGSDPESKGKEHHYSETGKQACVTWPNFRRAPLVASHTEVFVIARSRFINNSLSIKNKKYIY
ncbi:hypothetical protein [Chromohalobacter sp. 11-W]|uniref:hypothetical protein n=1 Tax=Chromohalobacter sp. 11-W TaxID=2994061 RepID=UPI0024683F82|nr:hypothetical protein [Chromohalobacter sp. 11-W]